MLSVVMLDVIAPFDVSGPFSCKQDSGWGNEGAGGGDKGRQIASPLPPA
jgi:hypothetical protein